MLKLRRSVIVVMKKLLTSFFAFLTSLLLVCCAQQKEPVRPLEGPGDLDHPHVVESYEMVKNAVQKNDMPFIVSEGIGGSVDGASNIEFFFHITYDDEINDQVIEVSTLAREDTVQRGFRMKLKTDLEEYVVDEAVVCAILAVDKNLSCEEAKEAYNEMLLGYSGYGCSNVISLNGYRIYIREERPGHILHVISEDNVYLIGSSSEYSNYTTAQLLNPENMGNKVAVDLDVKRIVETDNHIILEAFLEGNTVGVYCKRDIFAGCFASEGRLKLYCELSRPRENYDICLKLNCIEG